MATATVTLSLTIVDPIRRFLDELDAELVKIAATGERLDLYHLGRSALIARFGPRGLVTKDFDIVWMRQSQLEDVADKLFGQGTPRAERLGLYLDRVPQDLPPLPGWFKERCAQVPGPWRIIRLWQLDFNDLAVTKLKSFRAKDREDLQFLCTQGVLEPKKLRASLECAFRWILEKDGDEGRERAFANLETVVAYLEGLSTTL